ncbi:MAG: hypothetical protein KC496_00905 [Anaerolineae bacterium]|nr:hypothetical protein [Anaerolineae bacterium]
MGCKITNAHNIVPEWELCVGESVHLGVQKNEPVYRVVQVNDDRVLFLRGINPKTNEPEAITRRFIPVELAFRAIHEPPLQASFLG